MATNDGLPAYSDITTSGPQIGHIDGIGEAKIPVPVPQEETTAQKIARLEKEKAALIVDREEENWLEDEAFLAKKEAFDEWLRYDHLNTRTKKYQTTQRYKKLKTARERTCLRIRRIELDIKALKRLE